MSNVKSEAMFAQTRRKFILDMVNRQSFVTVNELCESLNMSPATIRNDLRQMHMEGLLERTHGGAISPAKTIYEPDTSQKEVKNVRQKEAIARRAVSYIHPGDVIALDSGTTTFLLAKMLVDIEKLTVVTYDLQIAAWLESNTNVSLFMAGGMMRRNFRCTGGQTTIDTLSKLHVDKAFIASNGVSVKLGLSTPNIDMGSIKSVLVGFADQALLLCDSSKINHNSFVSFSPLNRIHDLITDSGADPVFVEEVRAMNISVDIA